MKQHNPTVPQSVQRAAGSGGKEARQLAAPGGSLQLAVDPKKKPAQQKAVQLAADPKKKPTQQKEAQLAADPKKKPTQQKEAQLAADPKKKPAQQKAAAPNKMPEAVQRSMESSLNADFSDVNIHVGSKAASVGALAYTQGNDIHFAQGKFDTSSTSGKALLGHELTHVVQQRQGRVQPTTSINGLPVNDSPSLEREADVMGSKAASAS